MWNGIIRIIPSKFVLTMTHNHIYPKKFFYVTSDGGGCLDKRKLNLVNPSKSFNLLFCTEAFSFDAAESDARSKLFNIQRFFDVGGMCVIVRLLLCYFPPVATLPVYRMYSLTGGPSEIIRICVNKIHL